MIVLLDANVIYGNRTRDLLMWIGLTPGVELRWTDLILDEAFEHLARRSGLDPNKLAKTRRDMCRAIPDAMVTGYEHLIDEMEIGDPDDRHVLAAAVHAQAEHIVTFDSDFTPSVMQAHLMTAMTPDACVLMVFEAFPGSVQWAFEECWRAKKNPPWTRVQALERFSREFPQSMRALRLHMGL